jgi:putative Mg2+ transporter-C (MgtC) family protein
MLDETIVRVAIAAVAGALVGFERESHGQLAGMRTHALVAIGACLFTLIGAFGFPEHSRGPNVDPMRVAAQVVSGIGFIGAGAIIRDRGEIRGVTTAAALWVSAALGMAAGARLFDATAVGVLAVLIALVGLRSLRERGLRRLTHRNQRISASYERGHGTLGPLIAAVEAGGGQLQRLHIDDADDKIRHVELEVSTRNHDDLREQVAMLTDLPEIETITCS